MSGRLLERPLGRSTIHKHAKIRSPLVSTPARVPFGIIPGNEKSIYAHDSITLFRRQAKVIYSTITPRHPSTSRTCSQEELSDHHLVAAALLHSHSRRIRHWPDIPTRGVDCTAQSAR